jgi:alkanesulfonate monooxygenase SsuD/methylene tetrahydromethanopterin reductase-like flavin-dependent oxidoreductase (luciferase family)
MIASMRVRLASAARAELDARKRRMALMTYDDLLTRLNDTLLGEGGPDAAARHVTPTEVDQLTMIGTAEQIRAKLRQVQARGVKSVSWVLLMPYEEMRETLRRLAEEVLPEFR